LLVFSQFGFYFAVLASSTAIYRAMDGDIFLTSPLYVQLAEARTIPRQRLYQAASIEGVRDAAPFYVEPNRWRNAESRLHYRILVMGVNPSRNSFGSRNEVSIDGDVLIDSLTRPQLGPKQVGVKTQIGDGRVRIAGQYRIGASVVADGSVIVSDETFVHIFKNRSIDDINLGIVRVQEGADPQTVAASLRQTLPADTRVYTRVEMLDREEAFWRTRTSIGPIFVLSAVLGLVVGVVVVYQVVVTDVTNRIREYATLKAVGHDVRSLRRIVLNEALLFAALGFLIASIMSAALYAIISSATGLPMAMSVRRSALVFLFTVSMCWTAGLLATRKLRHADPADLF
jgi:putative ABC transport system permease protein